MLIRNSDNNYKASICKVALLDLNLNFTHDYVLDNMYNFVVRVPGLIYTVAYGGQGSLPRCDFLLVGTGLLLTRDWLCCGCV